LIVNIISQSPGLRACEDDGGCGVTNLVATTQSSQGSVANVRTIQDGQILSGFSQADVANDMVAGTGAFAGMLPLAKVRGLANLYPENLHIVVRYGAGIRRIADLPGKKVSMDLLGSGTRLEANIILAGYGLTNTDILSVNGTPDQAATLMRKGELDAFIVVAGIPARAVTTLTRDSVAAVIGLGEEQKKTILADHCFFSQSAILDGIYAGVSGVSTIAVGAQWVISADALEDLVHAICRALWSDSARIALDKGHPQGQHIRLARALDGISIPLHPGATRCYRELGLIK
jgi:TRAP transporter TAXI family solute receptor